MKTAAALSLALAVLGCAPDKPLPISTMDLCYRDQRRIADTKLAAELITADGYALKFHSVSCMAAYLHEQPQEVRAVYVTDYQTGRLIRAAPATFVWAEVNLTTRERDYLAFQSQAAAVAAGKQHREAPVDWATVQRSAGAGPKAP